MNGYIFYTSVHWMTVILYICATCTNLYGILFQSGRLEKISYGFIYLGLLIHTTAIVYWWIYSGHGPYLIRNEVLVSASWTALVFFLILVRIYPYLRYASVIVFPASFLFIALGLFYSPFIRTLPPTFRSIWLVFHVFFYKVSVASIVLSFGMSILYIVKKRFSFPWVMRIPSLEKLDLNAYRLAGFGFTFWAIAMLAGSIWAYNSWGRFWGWDLVETWSLITWLLLGLHLHLRRFHNWHGERSAYLYFLCVFLSLFSIYYVAHVDASIHSEYFME